MLNVLMHADPVEMWQPLILLASVVLQALYLIATVGPGRRWFAAYQPVRPKQIASFLTSMWVMYCAFAGPLDYLSDHYLFSVHMVQHMLEIMLMTPLFILGIPNWMFQPLLRRRLSDRIIRAWSTPIVAGAVFNVVYSGFHVPAVYDLALFNDSFHLFEHIVFFVTAFFMWLPIISPYDGLPKLTPGRRLLYLLYNYNLMMPISILLLVSRHPWFSFYVRAPRIIVGLSPLADVQWAAVIMMVGAVIPYLIVGIRAYSVQNESIWYE